MSFLTDPLVAFADWMNHPKQKRVYSFFEGSKNDAQFLSIKGANLCAMYQNKALKTPPGLVVSCAASMEFQQKGELSTHLVNEYLAGIHGIEILAGKVFGATSASGQAPLVLCVRGGALIPLPISTNPYYLQSLGSASESQNIPGMHKSMVVGLNDSIVDSLSALYSRRAALRLYSQFLLAFGTIIYGKPIEHYNLVYEKYKPSGGYHMTQTVLTEMEYEGIVNDFKTIQQVTDDVYLQLRLVVLHLYGQWYSDKSIQYREAVGFPASLGTSVIMQQYVIGDTGFMRTRALSANGNELEIDGFIVKASSDRHIALQEVCTNDPVVKAQLDTVKKEVEWMFQDAQDVEFTVDENDTVQVLQSRAGHRSPREMIRIAVTMVLEGIITKRKALLQIDPVKLEYYMRDHVEPQDMKDATDHVVIAQATAECSNGCVSGQVYFSVEEFLSAEDGNKIFVCNDCRDVDIPAIKGATAVVTASGSSDSEASILCRALGKPCLIKTAPLVFIRDHNGKTIGMSCGKYNIYSGEELYVDSEKGELYVGFHHPVLSGMDKELQRVLVWADEMRFCRVHGSSASCLDAKYSIKSGADGVFLDIEPNTIEMLQYLVATTDHERQMHLDAIAHSLRTQYDSVIRLLNHRRMRVRLFDHSMRDFLPVTEEDAVLLAESLNLGVVHIKSAMHHCKEQCIIGRGNGLNNVLIYQALVVTQLSALFDSLISAQYDELINAQSEGLGIPCDVAISGICNYEKEFKYVSDLMTKVMHISADKSKKSLIAQNGILLIISTPLECLKCHEIVREDKRITSICFDVKKLTENAMGVTAGDFDKMVQTRIIKGLLQESPLAFIDDAGVGKLMRMCVESCRIASPFLQVGADCETNVNTRSLYYLNSLKMDFITCDPFKVPIARVICAQAYIDEFSIAKTHDMKGVTMNQSSNESKMDAGHEDEWHFLF